MVEILESAGHVNANWLTQVLKSKGLIKSSVTDVTVEGFAEGVGLMAELARLRLVYEQAENLPDTMIIKCAAQNDNRQVAIALDFYNREVDFYANVGSASGLKVPQVFFGGVNQENYDQTLLMEDLGEVSARDQILGASEDEAFAAVELIAGMHGKYWEKVKGPESSWMYNFMSEAEAEKLKSVLYMPALEPAFDKFSDFFNDKTRQVCRTVGERYPEFWAIKPSSFETFIHGDYRQDNFMYPADSSSTVVMDWQISGRGKGIFDVTYFICQSLRPELRRQVEKELIKLWVDKLAQCGVKDYSFDQAYLDYRLITLGCLVYPITVCGTLDASNERGRALAECMLERNLQAIEELACTDLF